MPRVQLSPRGKIHSNKHSNTTKQNTMSNYMKWILTTPVCFLSDVYGDDGSAIWTLMSTRDAENI